MLGTKEVKKEGNFATREDRSKIDCVLKKGSTCLQGKKGRVTKKNNLLFNF